MALQSNGQLLVRHASPALSAAGALKAPLPFTNYRLEPLFNSTAHLTAAAAFGAMTSSGPSWSLAKPTAVTQMNPWDAAHHAAAQQGYTAYIEPDILHVPANVPPQAVASGGFNTHYPPPPGTPVSPGWHLDQQFDGFENIRKIATGTGVRIAHLDTGYTPKHASTPRRIQPQLGWNFWDDNDDTTDPGTQVLGLFQPGHGTATLAILAGNTLHLEFGTQTYQGDFGGAPDADVVPVRIGPTVVHILSSTVARGLNYALAPRGDTNARCQVVSLSHGGLPSAAWATAVNALYEAGVTVVAASGDNFYLGIVDIATQFTVYPSAFNRVTTALGATFAGKPYTTKDIGVMQGSWGPDAVMEKAIAGYTPNVAWMDFKTLPSGFDMSGGGTSASTPQIAAACALWLQQHGHKFPQDWRLVEACRLALFKSATDTGLPRKQAGWGILNVPGMLSDQIADAVLAESNGNGLKQSPQDSVSFAFWRELFGIPPAGSAEEEMYETEVAQIVLTSSNPTLIRANQAVGQGAKLAPGDRADMIAALKAEPISAALATRLTKAPNP
jgi:hypothetical protein